jgi:hypothetical protein
MINRSFGSTGLMVSGLGLECNNFGCRVERDTKRFRHGRN